jgi:hypothetical protein
LRCRQSRIGRTFRVFGHHPVEYLLAVLPACGNLFSISRFEFSRVNWNYGAVLSVWDRLFGTLARMT